MAPTRPAWPLFVLISAYYLSVGCARLQDNNLLLQPAQMTTAELNRTTSGAPVRLQQAPQAAASSHQVVAFAGDNPNKVSSFNQSLANVRLRWRQMESSLAGTLAAYANHLRANLIDLLGHGNQSRQVVSSACKSGLFDLLDGLAESKLWATQMVDSSARWLLPSGALEGTLTELGNFDECLAVSSPVVAAAAAADKTNNNRQPQVAGTGGQYCSLQIKPPLISRPRLHTACRKLPPLSATSGSSSSSSLSSSSSAAAANQTIFRLLSQNSQQFYYAGIRLGVCLPARCSQSDVQHLVNLLLVKYELVGQVKSCQQANNKLHKTVNEQAGLLADLFYYLIPTQQLNQLDHVQQVVLLLLVCLAGLTLAGTLLDNQRELRERQVSLTELEKQSGLPENDNNHLKRPTCQQQYQVYCGPSSTSSGASQESIVLEQQVHSPGPQQNPISEHRQHFEGADGKAAVATATAALPQLLPPLVGLNAGLHANRGANQRGDTKTSSTTDHKKGHHNHRWIRATPASLPPKQLEEPGLLRSILICFSVKSNLRSIGRLSEHSAATTTTTTTTTAIPPGRVVASNSRNQTDNQPTGGGLQSRAAGKQDMADVKVIHGLRTFAMIWIIFGHTIGLVNPEMMNNLFPLANLSCSSRLLQALLNATLAVNTFFMISGLVTVISFARKCKSALALIDPTTRVAADAADAGDVNGCNDAGRHRKGSSSNGPELAHRKRQHQPSSSTSGCSTDTFEVSSIDSASSLDSSASLNRCHHTQPERRQQSTQNTTTTGSWPADFQPLMWLLMRYLRLTPTYVVVIGASVLLPALGSGPFWAESVQPMGAACRLNWMYNLFYVNNFIDTDNLCLIHSWYLSNDWQFFLLALILFALFYKSKRLVIAVIISLTCASSAATFAITVENDFPPTIVTTSPAVAERWLFIHSLYYKPWPHLSSYLIGLFVGYLILTKERIQLAKGWRLTCWTLFSLVALAVLNSIYPWNVGLQVDPIITGLHSATFRTLWAACCGWLVFALVTRPKGCLALLLSWHGFQVTSRLTYCAYLVHPLVITYHFGALRERIDSSMYGQLHRFLATLMLSYLLGLLLSLLVECPSIKLQQLIVSRFLQRTAKNKKQTGPNTSQQVAQQTRTTNIIDNNSTLTGQTDFTWTTNSPSQLGADIAKSPDAIRLMAMAEARAQCGLESEFNFNLINNSRHLQNLSQPQLLGAGRQHSDPDDHTCCGHATSKGSSASPIDEDFQRKLAQAIGRGFKIRSKIVNGTLTRQPNGGVVTPRRFGPAKRLPATSRANLAPIFADPQELVEQHQENPRQPPKGSCFRRDCTTFVSQNQPNQTNPSPPSSQFMGPTKQPTDLNEMLLIGKQKLQSRPQNNNN